MSVVGRVESLWRYPVKSMAGEALEEAYVGFAGVLGDRLYAFHNGNAPAVFPYLTGRTRAEMVLYRPRFRHAERAGKPANLAAVAEVGPILAPFFPTAADLVLDVATPSGETFPIDDPRLIEMLGAGLRGDPAVTLVRSDRAMTDCRPVSLLSLATIRTIGREVGTALDKRRFRANVFLDLGAAEGFPEDAFVGQTLRIGPKAVVLVEARDPRCKMIGIDPTTAATSSELLKTVARLHGGDAGVYAVTLAEGIVRAGDEVVVM